MGQPVVHFEVIGKDGGKLQSYYSALFGWDIDADNPRVFEPDKVPGTEVELGQFTDPEGHLIGLTKAAS